MLFILATTLTLFVASSDSRQLAENYISNYKDDAIKEMKVYGVPASITLAQGMLESKYGISALAKEANNHFGIKCHSDWAGETYHMDDDSPNECFRKYKSVLESYADHSQFLRTRKRYATLFELKITDYRGWANGLKQAGYATDPEYPKRLIRLIEENQLYKYDDSSVVVAPPTFPADEKRSPSQLKPVWHKVENFNRIKSIIVNASDNCEGLAIELDIRTWQLYKYNDLKKGTAFKTGERIYLQPKRRKGDVEFHVVKKGETLRDISQQHGIKIKFIRKKNRLMVGEEPKEGDKLYLRRTKPLE